MRCVFLPALTSAACRSKMNVTKAVSVESNKHRFVFHLVVHLCISMVSARGCAENGRLLNEVRNAVPSYKSTRRRRRKKSVATLQLHVWGTTDRALQIRSPSALLSHWWWRALLEKSAQATPPPERCAPSGGGWTNAPLTRARNPVEDTDTGKSSAHQITGRESCLGDPPPPLPSPPLMLGTRSGAASGSASLHPGET